ncbi:MAG: Amuc_1099 family pilus-like system protein, partial [Roseibacillus sp.]
EKNPANGLEETNNYATLEDLSPAKKGDKIELKKGSRNFVVVRDYTAHLFLNAIGQADKVIKIAERTSFSLPFDPSAADKPYTFAAVTESGDVVIEWQEGGEAKSMTLTPISQP